MKLLQLLTKVAFICNVCFLFTSFIQWLPNPPEGELVSTTIIMGYVLAILVNLFVNGWLLIRWIAGRWKKGIFPSWLLIVNALFFVAQVTLILVHTLR
jgi:hypothetical protein